MRLIPKYDDLFTRLTVFFSTFLKLLLNILMVLVCVAIAVGIVKSGYDLYSSLGSPLSELLQKVLVDIVFIVALLEISIILLGYLKDGRVHVRYIVDTILIIMLNEIVVLWFKGPKLDEAIAISVIVAVLAMIRISVTRFAPHDDDL